MQPSDLRIALFSGNYNYVRDGPTQALNLLVGHLLSRGAHVRIYSPTSDTPAFLPTGDLISVPSIRVPGERGEFRFSPRMTRKIRYDVTAFAPNLIHVSAPEFLGHAAVTYGRRRGIPVVASLHTRFETYLRYYYLGFLEPALIKLFRRFYNRCDQVMTPGQSMADLIKAWGVTTPTSIWSRGVDHERFNPKSRSWEWRRSLGIEDDEVAIGFLGRLVKEKGLDVFAEVVAELRRRGVKHHVLVVGEGPAREWFAERVPTAAFAGFQRGDDLGRAVASMDILFNPSVTETFGNVTLEAMASGIPIVAARATGAVDLIEDGVNGFLVPPRDCNAYADAIERLVNDDNARHAAGEAGRVKAAGYRWDMINQNVLNTYLEVMARRGG